MTYQKKIPLKGAVITKEKLLGLIKILTDYFPEIETTITFKDNTRLSEISMEELESIDFQNRKISMIEVAGRIYAKGEKAHTRMHSLWGDIYTIEFEFEHYERYLSFCAAVEKWCVSVCSRRKYINFWHSWTSFAVFFLVYAVSFSVLAFKINWEAVIVLFLIFLPLLFAWMTHSVIKFAFPLTEMDIGTNPSKTFRKVAWAIISVLIIPIMISIIL